MSTSDEDVFNYRQNFANSSASLEEVTRIHSRIDRSVKRAEQADASFSRVNNLKKIVWEAIYPDLILKHLDWPSLKIILRSWLMMWALTLLCICGGTAEFMGPSSFLANFAAGIEIDGNLSVASALVYCMGDLLSMLFACLVSIVTLAIGWRVRGNPSTESIIRDLLASGKCSDIPDPTFENCVLPEMHMGYFLDIKVTVITIFGMLFSFTLCGLFQTTSKYGKLAWLLNSLYTIIVFPFNNLMPVFKPWLFARNCVVPMAMAFAARFFVSLVVLPFSSNFKVIYSLGNACLRLRSVCERMQSLTMDTRPSSPGFSEKYKFISSETQQIFTKLIINEVDLEIVNNLEVWFSHFEKADLAELRSQVRLIMSSLSSFQFFYEAMADQNANITYMKQTGKGLSPMVTKYRASSIKMKNHRLTPNFVSKMLKESWKETGVYELRQKDKYHRELTAFTDLHGSTQSGDSQSADDDVKDPEGASDNHLHVPPSHGSDASRESRASDASHAPHASHAPQTSPASSLPGSRDTAELMTYEGLDQAYIEIVQLYEPLVQSTNDLLQAIAQWLLVACKLREWLLLYGRERRRREFQERFEAVRTALDRHLVQLRCARVKPAPRGQQMALYRYVCLHYARRVKGLARWCVTVHSERPDPVLVWPFKQSTSFISPASQIDDMEFYGIDNNMGDSLGKRYTSFKPLSQVQARNPDSTPPRSVLHIFGLVVQTIHQWCYDPDVLFCVKRAVLTVATLTPYFCRPTCRKAFQHWFLWVAVLTAYTVARQAVDGVYGLLAKFVYTFLGCLVGMVGWYISTGSGSGNPYGYAAVTAFVWLYICFQRQFNKHFIPATSVVFSCTVVLVLGNSWSYTHVALNGVELGSGFSVAWVRFVTVTIGITVSFLGTIFPYAYTAKQAVRSVIGTCLERLGDLQASISNFGVQRYNISTTHIVAHNDLITSSARAIITNLNSAETLRKRLVYEPPLAGIYPTYRYKLLINFVNEITLLYSLVYAFLDEIQDSTKIPEILQIMGWTDPQLSSGVYSLVYMACRALTDGKALPSVTCANLVEQHLLGVLHKHHIKPNGDRLYVYNDGKRYHARDEANMEIVTAIALSTQIYERLDGVVILIKELVGEVYDLNMDLFDLEKQLYPTVL